LREAISLVQLKTARGSVDFRLGDQARFTDPRIAADQQRLPMAVARAIDTLIEYIKLG